MPVPPLTSEGLLPPGIHDCSLEDVRARFGRFQGSDQRPRLWNQLLELVSAMQTSGLCEALLVDGSFVTEKPAPNDVDILAVLRPGHNFERELSAAEYALVSRTLLRRRFGFDVLLAESGTRLYETYIEFFSRVRERPSLRKGLLRLQL